MRPPMLLVTIALLLTTKFNPPEGITILPSLTSVPPISVTGPLIPPPLATVIGLFVEVTPKTDPPLTMLREVLVENDAAPTMPPTCRLPAVTDIGPDSAALNINWFVPALVIFAVPAKAPPAEV